MVAESESDLFCLSCCFQQKVRRLIPNEKLNSIGPFQCVLDEVFLMELLLVKLERSPFLKGQIPHYQGIGRSGSKF